MNNIKDAYKSLNNSFQKTLIFHIGIDAGFFTEYTYMINAMLYCLQNRIQFKLFTADANFGFQNGWRDYFEPFCEEVSETFHRKYNIHSIPSWLFLFRTSIKQKNLSLLKWKLKVSVFTKIGSIIAFKTYKKRILLTHDAKLNNRQHFYIPELKIDGDYMHAFNKMVDITWHLNKDIAKQCNNLIKELQLPRNYIGCQIRGGDKITEVNLLKPDLYMPIIQKSTTNNSVFILTDDYHILELLQNKYPSIHWYSLCSPEEKGYTNSEFTQRTGNKKRVQMIRFITSIQVLLNSSLFIGSITTGPSIFILKRLHPNIHLIDYKTERLTEVITLNLSERCKLAENYIAKSLNK